MKQYILVYSLYWDIWDLLSNSAANLLFRAAFCFPLFLWEVSVRGCVLHTHHKETDGLHIAQLRCHLKEENQILLLAPKKKTHGLLFLCFCPPPLSPFSSGTQCNINQGSSVKNSGDSKHWSPSSIMQSSYTANLSWVTEEIWVDLSEVTNTMALKVILEWKLKLCSLISLNRVYRWGAKRAGQIKGLMHCCITLFKQQWNKLILLAWLSEGRSTEWWVGTNDCMREDTKILRNVKIYIFLKTSVIKLAAFLL